MSCRGGGYDWPREATSLLIDLYEGYPCLYLPTLPEYHNRNVRLKALTAITKEFNERKLTNLSLEDIKKKIHGIRAQFLVEFKKIKKSGASGASADDVYLPKLWCFEQLKFLQQGANVVAQGDSNLGTRTCERSQEIEQSLEQSNTEPISEPTELHVEVLYDGDVNTLSDVEIDMLSPTSTDASQGPSTSRAPSRGESMLSPTSSQSRAPSRGEKRKQFQREGTAKRKKDALEKEKISGLISDAVSTLQTITAPVEIQPEPQNLKKHSLFGQFVADEMEALEDEEIIDQLKEEILQSIFSAKRKQRILKK